MSYDGINRINFLRKAYQAEVSGSSSEVVRELQKIKNEIRITNEENARDNDTITSATKSPYLTDQKFYKKDVVYNSAEEIKWKEVKSADQVEKETQENFLESNRRKLDII
jgi:hypothetical protein